MKFKTVAEAFNHYRNHSITDIEKRAAEIGQLIDSDPNAEIASLNIELDGLKEAKANVEQRSAGAGAGFNPITGMGFQQQAQQDPEGDVFASTEYRSAFFKTLLGQKLSDTESRTYKRAMELVGTERRADAFNTTTDSAAVLPTTTLNEIISKARKMGGLISVCRNFNIPTNLRVPIGTPTSKAAWHVEGAAVDSEKATTAYVSFAGYELLKIMSMSATVRRMSISAFEAYIIDELSNSVMEAIADALVNGSGSGQGTGVLTGITWDATNSFTYASGQIPKYTDFTKMMGLLKRGYGAGARFAMSNATLYNNVYSIVDANDRPIFITDPKNEEIGYILGKAVTIDDNIEDGVIVLGNFSYMGYNIPQGILIEMSRESSFKNGLIDYRALAIADTKPLVSEAFIKLSEGA
ncbi:phage major capsid protein [Cohnella sp. AR92]|uniref:phage major capsid protein n=1 Tax=Cohnella sp. AR92 TaxID=648716 RepID=UPI000F8F479E|nr:phage major capsid protein [Cohnella sp. AR92]RUS47678.1 phage major capsid protein [Cohnella sp. AR92]